VLTQFNQSKIRLFITHPRRPRAKEDFLCFACILFSLSFLLM